MKPQYTGIQQSKFPSLVTIHFNICLGTIENEIQLEFKAVNMPGQENNRINNTAFDLIRYKNIIKIESIKPTMAIF